jgi:hypothetical protein
VGAADAVGDGRMPDRIRPSVSGLKDTRDGAKSWTVVRKSWVKREPSSHCAVKRLPMK